MCCVRSSNWRASYVCDVIWEELSIGCLERSNHWKRHKRGKLTFVFLFSIHHKSLTLSTHALEGYSSHFVCLSVCLSVYLSNRPFHLPLFEIRPCCREKLKKPCHLSAPWTTPIYLQTVKCRHTTLVLLPV